MLQSRTVQFRVAPLILGLAAATACGGREAPRAYGEALLIVDTDLPLAFATRLRVDMYSDGAWFDSREVTRGSTAEWPASLGLYSDDDTKEKLVWVRFRVYPNGGQRDYRGERFRDIGAEAPTIDPTSRPRLVQGGVDITPAAEPDPLVTVDRLLFVRLRPGVRGAVRVTLHGACAGTMAKLAATAGSAPTFGQAESCVDTEQARVRVEETPLDPDRTVPTKSLVGTYGVEPCDGQPSPPERDAACIPGGVFLLGSRDFIEDVGDRAWPPRLVHIRRFFLDRHEVTVGRYRAAVAAGFAPTTPRPTTNDGPIATVLDFRDPGYCSYGSIAGTREEFAITCLPWNTALRFCENAGGMLPTEAQWEYAAIAAGRSTPSLYTWGDEAATCDRTVYGRIDPVHPSMRGLCSDLAHGPHPVRDVEPGDVTPLGVFGLAGGVSEWTRDSIEDYDGQCWAASPLTDGACLRPQSENRTVRGAAWTAEDSYLFGKRRFRSLASAKETMIGFRCAYPSRVQE